MTALPAPLSLSPTCNRRAFLGAIAGMSLAQLLAGCGAESGDRLHVRLLNRSIPPQILNEFRKFLQQADLNATLDFAPEVQLQTLFTLLQTWKQRGAAAATPPTGIPLLNNSPPALADLVTIGDTWLADAVRQGLIHPLDASQFKHWQQLPQSQQWQALLRRNAQGQPDRQGQVWAAPYRWGSLVIAYRRDLFEEHQLPPPTDWADLWRSDLQRQISLPDQARVVIGAALKKLGKSYNEPNLKALPTLTTDLQALQRQVKFYSSETSLQPLLLGDIWVAVGWSTDVLPLMQRSQQVAAVVPRSGTALWADLWVRPVMNPTVASPLVNQWIDFCWQPQTANQLSALSWAASPVLFGGQTAPADLRQPEIMLPDRAIRERSEFLLPLAAATVTQYREIWERLRQTG